MVLSTSPAVACARVALIEDDDDSREVTAYFLSEAGFAVDEFTQAEDALASFAESMPAIVVTDVTLPGIGGYELARILRDDPRTAHVPIVALTGRSDTSPEQRALFDRLLTKPFGPDDLERIARELIVEAAPAESVPTSVALHSRGTTRLSFRHHRCLTARSATPGEAAPFARGR